MKKSSFLFTAAFCLGIFISPATPAALAPDFANATELYRQKNYLAAFPAFFELANNGDPRAQTITALMYKYGEGTEQDLEQAFYWYKTAAEQDYPAAQYHTGVMLADGLGTEQDQDGAIAWLTKAADNGFERALDKLASLNASATVLGQSNEDLTAWSKDWDLSLPTDLVLSGGDQPALETNPVYLVQVGAMRTQAAANRLWQVLSSHHINLFENRSPIITLVENADHRVYRIQTGPFANFRAAEEFCNRLMASNIQAGCLPIKQ